MLKRILCFAGMSCLLASCAHAPQDPDTAVSYGTNDPYESYNRAMFNINVVIDGLFVKPVATLYADTLPDAAQTGVNNAFQNLWEPVTVLNDMLQAKPVFAFTDTLRFIFNTTIGIGGLFDVAKHMNLPPHDENFSMTMAYWSGSDKAVYLMLPFLGPNTTRGIIGFPVDYFTNPWPYFMTSGQKLVYYGTRAVTLRAQFLDTDQLIKQSFDPYTFVRDFYMQYVTTNLQNNHMTYPEFLKAYRERQIQEPAAS